MKPGRPRKPRTNPSEKTCAACRVTRPARQFYPAAKAHDGLQTWCKYCAASYNAAFKSRRFATLEIVDAA